MLTLQDKSSLSNPDALEAFHLMDKMIDTLHLSGGLEPPSVDEGFDYDTHKLLFEEFIPFWTNIHVQRVLRFTSFGHVVPDKFLSIARKEVAHARAESPENL